MNIRIDHYFHHVPSEDSGLLREVLGIVKALKAQGVTMSATMQQVLDDLDNIKTQAGTYIAGRDAIDVQLRADLAAALAAAGISPAEQADIDSAFSKAEEALALLTPPVPGTGPT